ncbi:segregation and condensation protein A [Aneurinibacillus uraniidurans]|uniref:segregation and condensation protein A n=1 Tax=Aneurinibacillus uraniidurans TaxID=2966586 RepID=UPI00234B2AD1|nr:segregation/condensation protein A [Aneurinibacillus sp. B1]WCN36806.1 segregation/condensation protein A [Aneurinibacillus sp. B1]
MAVDIKLDTFEGPLDLLLHLIDRAEVDIYDIPMVELTDQYMNHLYVMQELQIDVASEFLVMAATLLAIKSKLLLPRREEPLFDDWQMDEYEEEDPREELVQRLLEYKKYKQLAEIFREREREQTQVFTRPAEDLSHFIPEEDRAISNVTIYDLVDALQKALKRVERGGQESSVKVQRDEISIGDRMDEIRTKLHRIAKPLPFSELLASDTSKVEIVTTFLAILELMKTHDIVCEQSGLFEEIMVSAM